LTYNKLPFGGFVIMTGIALFMIIGKTILFLRQNMTGSIGVRAFLSRTLRKTQNYTGSARKCTSGILAGQCLAKSAFPHVYYTDLLGGK